MFQCPVFVLGLCVLLVLKYSGVLGTGEELRTVLPFAISGAGVSQYDV